MSEYDLDHLREADYIDVADLAFARTVQRLGRCDDRLVGLAAALVSRATANGHVCLDLAATGQQGILPINGRGTALRPPDANAWQKHLTPCGAIGIPGDFRPLILDRGRLYLHRFWTFEQQLALALLRRCSQPLLAEDNDRLSAALEKLFPEGESDQRRAARAAATQLFTVISGGPGTGKTYTIARIISLLHRVNEGGPMRIHLAAPTGKAAARLQEAVEKALGVDADSQASPNRSLPKAQTLHRLLGYHPRAARFNFDTENPLDTDAVIVDEASMVDLALMHHLVEAVPAHARLVLVGDKDQLASVEAGAVLGDICFGMISPGNGHADPGENGHVMPDSIRLGSLDDHIVVLGKSYRFDSGSGIDALGSAINAGDSHAVLALLDDPHFPSLSLHRVTARRQIAEGLGVEMVPRLRPLFEASTPDSVMARLNGVKALTAVRNGPFGVGAVNDLVERALAEKHLVPHRRQGGPAWYPGRPVMVTRNDYFQGLFNGDIGVALSGGTDGELQVCFPDAAGGYRRLAPHQLTEHQTVYAMTVHKSQGSEFEHVILILPDRDSPLLTRELIYTAVTRARQSITIWASPDLLTKAVERPIRRTTGLREALWAGAIE